MNPAKALLFAARPKTLPASLSPVFLGGFLAIKAGEFHPLTFTLTLLFSLLIQIGTNYANDYFDFIKGADTSARIGPKRAVQQGWIEPKAMWQIALLTFASAFLIAITLMLKAGLWSVLVAALCILFGILYTGGPKPLGYLGLGELLVFFFFGPVALAGTYFLQTGHLTNAVWLASIPPGLLSAAILTANNLRDYATDAVACKKTVVVRFGLLFGKRLFLSFLLLAALFSIPFSPLLPLVFLATPLNDVAKENFPPLLPKTARLDR